MENLAADAADLITSTTNPSDLKITFKSDKVRVHRIRLSKADRDHFEREKISVRLYGVALRLKEIIDVMIKDGPEISIEEFKNKFALNNIKELINATSLFPIDELQLFFDENSIGRHDIFMNINHIAILRQLYDGMYNLRAELHALLP